MACLPLRTSPDVTAPRSQHGKTTSLFPLLQLSTRDLQGPAWASMCGEPAPFLAPSCHCGAGGGQWLPETSALFQQTSVRQDRLLHPCHLLEGMAACSWGRNHLKISRILKLPHLKCVSPCPHIFKSGLGTNASRCLFRKCPLGWGPGEIGEAPWKQN